MRKLTLILLYFIVIFLNGLKTYPQNFSEEYLIGVGCHFELYDGSSWKTDVSICSFMEGEKDVKVELLKSGLDNTNPESFYLHFKSEGCEELSDIFQKKFSYNGLGALRISSNSPLIINSKIYYESFYGTHSQYVPSFQKKDLLKNGEIGYLSYLKRNNNFRTNIGFTNFSDKEIKIEGEIGGFLQDIFIGFEINLLPFSHIQINDVFNKAPADVLDGWVIFTSKTEGASYFAYASVINNNTNDAIFISFNK